MLIVREILFVSLHPNLDNYWGLIASQSVEKAEFYFFLGIKSTETFLLIEASEKPRNRRPKLALNCLESQLFIPSHFHLKVFRMAAVAW